jgi:hypothetical protein
MPEQFLVIPLGSKSTALEIDQWCAKIVRWPLHDPQPDAGGEAAPAGRLVSGQR